MKKWFYKSLVVAVALLTFGAITPKHEIWSSLEIEKNEQPIYIPTENDISAAIQLDDLILEQPAVQSIHTITTTAKEQAYVKFGTRIGPVIENEFETIIFPKLEEVIATTLSPLSSEEVQSLVISEKPSGDYSEKIFHITDASTRSDLIRFHVRTENRPFEGYYYNFHYHLKEDNYSTHYSLGDIYWSKNMPPKWLS